VAMYPESYKQIIPAQQAIFNAYNPWQSSSSAGFLPHQAFFKPDELEPKSLLLLCDDMEELK